MESRASLLTVCSLATGNFLAGPQSQDTEVVNLFSNSDTHCRHTCVFPHLSFTLSCTETKQLTLWVDMRKSFLHQCREFGSADLEQKPPVAKEGEEIKSMKQSFACTIVTSCSPLKNKSYFESFVSSRNYCKWGETLLVCTATWQNRVIAFWRLQCLSH